MADLEPNDLLANDLGTLHAKSLTILKRIRDSAIDPDTGRKSGPTFSISKAAALVGRTASAIREAERDGRLPQRERTASGHRVQYTLEELDHMRAVFGTRPWREPTARAALANRQSHFTSLSTLPSMVIVSCSSTVIARQARQ